jgi:hypothetical protein
LRWKHRIAFNESLEVILQRHPSCLCSGEKSSLNVRVESKGYRHSMLDYSDASLKYLHHSIS